MGDEQLLVSLPVSNIGLGISDCVSLYNNFEKQYNSRNKTVQGIPKCLEISYQEVLCDLIFLPEFSEVIVEWLTFQNSAISGFSQNFSVNSHTICPCFEIFRIFD